MHIDAQLDARQARRLAAQARAEARLDAREERASAMVGELVRDGRTVCYVYPVGGRYREGSRAELVRYLLRTGRV